MASPVGAIASAAAPSITVGEAIERIKQHIGIPWMTKTVDRIVAGSPDIAVKGIATTMMATLDVVERAQKRGCNLIITHEPTFYLHEDTYDTIAADTVVKEKLAFIQEHDMAIFRLHDHWHRRSPDGIATGMARQLGWEKNLTEQKPPQRFHFDGVPLAQFAQEIQAKLHARTMRVLGDPTMSVHNVAASWGYISRDPGIALVSDPNVDVVVGGEAREWEVVEYVQDCITAGEKKALILIGHVLSEQSGMVLAAEWLRTFVSEVPVVFVPATEPFWSPDHPVAVNT